jgi:ribosomal protein S17E
VDRNDPIQLNLLYVQSRDAIVAGRYPCTLEEAIQFASLQCHIVNGNYDESKHRAGFLNLKEFLPEEYRKNKDVEKKIFAEHRKLSGLDALSLKYRYTQLCRSLKTYGVTFFTVKEMGEKKNKLIPRLLGVAKDFIIKVDPETKEMIKTWPITSLRRWAASPTSFTMDFGDYQDAVYSVQTTQGDQMNQLIAGYIDIIVKKKKEADREVVIGVEETAAVEEVIRPVKSRDVASKSKQQSSKVIEEQISHQGIVIEGESVAAQGKIAEPVSRQAQFASASPMRAVTHEARQAVITKIQTGFATVSSIQNDMALAMTLPPEKLSKSSVVYSNHEAVAHLAALLAECNSIVASAVSQDPNEVVSHICKMANELNFVSSACKSIYKGHPDVLGVARSMAVSTHNLFEVAQEVMYTNANVEDLVNGAHATSASAQKLLEAMKCSATTSSAHRLLIERSKQISQGTQELVRNVQVLSAALPNKDAQLRLLEDVRICAAQASQVAVTTAIVAPLAATPPGGDQLRIKLVELQQAMENLVHTAELSCAQKELVKPLKDSAARLKLSVKLLRQSANSGDLPDDELLVRALCDDILRISRSLQASMGDSSATLSFVDVLAVRSTELSGALRSSSKQNGNKDEFPQERMAMLPTFSDLVVRVVKLSTESAKDPRNNRKAEMAVQELSQLQSIARKIQIRPSQVASELLSDAQNLATAITLLASESSVLSNNEVMSRLYDVMEAKRQILLLTQTSPHNDLTTASQQLYKEADNFISNVRGHIQDDSAQRHVGQCQDQMLLLGLSLDEANAAAGAIEVNSAIRRMLDLQKEIQSHSVPHQAGDSAKLKTACRSLAVILTESAKQVDATSNSTCVSPSAVADAVQEIVRCADPDTDHQATAQLVYGALSMLQNLQACKEDPQKPFSIADESAAIQSCIGELLESAREEVEPTTSNNPREVVIGASAAMVNAANKLKFSRSIQGDVKRSASELESAFRKLVGACKLVLPEAQGDERAEILGLVQSASSECVGLILAANSATTTGDDQQLDKMVNMLSASVNRLLEKCSLVGNLGNLETIQALQGLELADLRVSSSMFPVSSERVTYSDCVGKVVDNSKKIAIRLGSTLNASNHIDDKTMAEVCNLVACVADTSLVAASLVSTLPIEDMQPLHSKVIAELQRIEQSQNHKEICDAIERAIDESGKISLLAQQKISSSGVSNEEQTHLVKLESDAAAAIKALQDSSKCYSEEASPDRLEALRAEAITCRDAVNAVYAFSTRGSPRIRSAAGSVLQAARFMASSPGDDQAINESAQLLSSRLGSLALVLRDATPGLREIQEAQDRVRSKIAAVEELQLQCAIDGSRIALRHDSNLLGCATAVRSNIHATLESKTPKSLSELVTAYSELFTEDQDSGLCDLVKRIGENIFAITEAMKTGNSCDPAIIEAPLDDLILMLTLRENMVVISRSPVDQMAGSAPLNAMQSATKELVSLTTRSKKISDFRPHINSFLSHFRSLHTGVKTCESRTPSNALQSEIRDKFEKMSSNLLLVLTDRSNISQLSSSINLLLKAAQEAVLTSSLCQEALETISTKLVPECRNLIEKSEKGQFSGQVHIVPGVLQSRAMQLADNLNAIVAAVDLNDQAMLGEAIHSSVSILRNLQEECRKSCVMQKSTSNLQAMNDLLSLWSSLVENSMVTVTKPKNEAKELHDNILVYSERISNSLNALVSKEKEDEFTKLAQVIEAALKNLPDAQDSANGMSDVDRMQLDSMVDWTKALATTAFDIISAASACQKELTQGHASDSPSRTYFNDGTWSEGLVSAARNVVDAFETVISTVVACGQRRASQERLAATALAVSSATAQLITAASVKVDPNAGCLIRLKTCAKSVSQASDKIVSQITSAPIAPEEQSIHVKAGPQTTSRLAFIEAQTNVLAMEKELERARARLTGLKKSRYAADPS